MTAPAAIADQLAHIEQMLQRLTAQPQEWPRWLAIPTASRYSDLSTTSIRRLISAGKLTAHRPCRGKVLVDRRQLDEVVRNATTEVRTGRGFHLHDVDQSIAEST